MKVSLTRDCKMLYIMIGRNTVKVNNTHEWAAWFEWVSNNGGRNIGRTEIKGKKKLKKNKRCNRGQQRNSTSLLKKINSWRISDTLISTVFLGVDHSMFGEPLLFETMIFGGRYNELQRRYATLEQAVLGHQQVIGLLI